jgi:hypothetical protein
MLNALPNLLKNSVFGILLSVAVFSVQQTSAQTNSTQLHNIIGSVNHFTDTLPPEKVYLQTDRHNYAIGDTIWFKAYLFDALSLAVPRKSRILYIEMADERNQVACRMMVYMKNGLGWGNIAINSKQLPQGYYTLRAYTNWMLNFDEHYVFKKQIYIGNPADGDMLIKSKLSIKQIGDKQNAGITLQLSKLGNDLLRLKDFDLKITEGRKTLYHDKAETSIDGILNFNFNIPERADTGKLDIVLQHTKATINDPKYIVPLILNRPEKIDLQFMPEGGNLVAGLDNHIAFKALAENGSGSNISGYVYNSKQQQVATFQSQHKGMGVFNLYLETGEVYMARIKLPGGLSKAYALPAVKQSGILLKVNNGFKTDSLKISIGCTDDIPATNVYYLIAQSRGVCCFGAVLSIKGGGSRFSIDKKLFPTGIARFTLLNAAKQPLNERIVYINHQDNIKLSITANKTAYVKRDSVGLLLHSALKDGKPISANFSVSVTDDGQVKNDNLSNSNLKSWLLLTSDLKGYVEDPGYYFQSNYTADVWEQLDALLLTQGWVNYNWASVFNSAKPPVYSAEAAFTIQGKVSNIFNKPVEKSRVMLLSKKPALVLDTLTNSQGTFVFNNIYPVDTAVYLIQARNKNGQSFNVGVEMNEFKPPVLSATNRRIIPWYVNTDTTQFITIKNNLTYKLELDKQQGRNLLHEVAIKDKKVVKDSKNLNGVGEADISLNQEDMEKERKATLGEMLQKYSKGGFHTDRNNVRYLWYTQLLHIVIDGINLDDFKPEPISPKDYYDTYLNYLTAEDIKGIEIMKSPQYAAVYKQAFLDPMVDLFAQAFIEVTTYSGHGAFYKSTAGTYLFKPLSFAPRKEFYSPKYTIKNNSALPDTRLTIFWAPNIITDNEGTAKLSFYTADKPGTYTVVVEGTDMSGNIESTQTKIIVK